MKIIASYLHRLKYVFKVLSAKIFFNLNPSSKKKVINNFHNLFYDDHALGKGWHNTFFLGVPTQKCPLDLFIYQEIIFEIKPDLIIETGTAYGGGALYLASLCDLMNHGKVVTIDITNTRKSGEHKRLKYIIGSSTDEKIFDKIKKLAKGKRKVLVILDSDHSEEHVTSELNLYYKLVTRNSYLIVEDTNVNGHPAYKEHGPGPMEAVTKFLRKHKNFAVDKSREKFYMTFNPNGYLRKIRG